MEVWDAVWFVEKAGDSVEETICSIDVMEGTSAGFVCDSVELLCVELVWEAVGVGCDDTLSVEGVASVKLELLSVGTI